METTKRDDANAPLYRLAARLSSDLRLVLQPLIIFETVFKGMAVLIGILGTAWVISPLVESTGRAAVTNNDIARFMVSPPGSGGCAAGTFVSRRQHDRACRRNRDRFGAGFGIAR